MDKEACCAVIHGVAKSRIRLRDWTELNLILMLSYKQSWGSLIKKVATSCQIGSIFFPSPPFPPPLASVTSFSPIPSPFSLFPFCPLLFILQVCFNLISGSCLNIAVYPLSMSDANPHHSSSSFKKPLAPCSIFLSTPSPAIVLSSFSLSSLLSKENLLHGI